MRRKVLRIGNGVGVTLPDDLLSRYGLRVGDEVEVTGAPGHLELAPRRSLGDLLASWQPIAAGLTNDDIVDALNDERGDR